jgi:hypothetical protein
MLVQLDNLTAKHKSMYWAIVVRKGHKLRSLLKLSVASTFHVDKSCHPYN